MLSQQKLGNRWHVTKPMRDVHTSFEKQPERPCSSLPASSSTRSPRVYCPHMSIPPQYDPTLPCSSPSIL